MEHDASKFISGRVKCIKAKPISRTTWCACRIYSNKFLEKNIISYCISIPDSDGSLMWLSLTNEMHIEVSHSRVTEATRRPLLLFCSPLHQSCGNKCLSTSELHIQPSVIYMSALRFGLCVSSHFYRSKDSTVPHRHRHTHTHWSRWMMHKMCDGQPAAISKTVI